ncbi:MAG TPA: hypothetical protein VK469_22865, partial [Candidatus Kapabacteria bacterium]|nr:hypothetical protein [Candidatus Kapabacteria bacterium]
SPRKPDQFYISYLGHANKSGPATLPLLSKTEWIQKIKEKIEKPNAKKLPGFISYEVLRRKIKGCIKRGTLTNNRVCLIFVDDVVGSGGQLEDYIKKFIGYLKKNIAEEKWVQLEGLEIIAIFALGVHNKVFESILKISERNKESCFLYGTLKKNEELSTPIKVHVAHYTRSIQEIFNANNKFLKEVEETLRKYAVIMELRDEDYPCDFEPLGWKENGGLITTYANAQGNTIPVIWRDYKWDSDSGIQEDDFYIKEWFALYPRYFNPLTPGKKLDKNEKKDIVANDIKVLKCKEMKKCPVNPEKWTKRYFEDYWKNKKNEHPPCKFKHGK